MENLDIKSPVNLDAETIASVIEQVCATANLRVTMKSTLKKYPGCIHWHLKKEDERGILEITWWPCDAETKRPRLWLSVHRNRTADWVESLKPEIKTMIEARTRTS
jgi:hypothetical protein